jgi:hypothetical protein
MGKFLFSRFLLSGGLTPLALAITSNFQYVRKLLSLSNAGNVGLTVSPLPKLVGNSRQQRCSERQSRLFFTHFAFCHNIL